jgi:hypothetical protein
MISRADWGARPPDSTAPFVSKAGFQLHHFASPRAKADHNLCDNDVRNVQAVHMDDPTRNWSDIAYNFLVCNHGAAFEGRGWNVRSGASASSACNGNRLAIVWMGHSDKDVFDIHAANTIKALEREGNDRGWPSNVVGHRDCSTSACPGDVLHWWMGQQNWADDTPPPLPQPPPPGPVSVLILGPPTVSIGQMQRWATAAKATRRFVELALYAFTASVAHGVDPAVTYAVMAHETAFGRFGGVLNETFHNWGGIKTTNGGDNADPNAHQRFAADSDGVRAVAQHAGLYAGLYVPAEQVVDPRHFEPIRGVAGIGLPSAGWTWAGATHSQNVADKALAIRATR